MKLIHCPQCQDIMKLNMTAKMCVCGKSWGIYIDGLNAIIGGKAIPIGIENHSFFTAVCNQPLEGWGTMFNAFVIPVNCATIKKDDGKFCPQCGNLMQQSLLESHCSKCDWRVFK